MAQVYNASTREAEAAGSFGHPHQPVLPRGFLSQERWGEGKRRESWSWVDDSYAVIPGERETGGFLRLASKLVWPNQWTLASVSDLFKIRHQAIKEDIWLVLPSPWACVWACTRTHRANERLQTFLSWAWVCVCIWVCEERVGVGPPACQALLWRS